MKVHRQDRRTHTNRGPRWKQCAPLVSHWVRHNYIRSDEHHSGISPIDWLSSVYSISMLAAIWDAHVKGIGKAVCGCSSQSPTHEVTSDMQFTDMLYQDFHLLAGLTFIHINGNRVGMLVTLWDVHVKDMVKTAWSHTLVNSEWYEIHRHTRFHLDFCGHKQDMKWL